MSECVMEVKDLVIRYQILKKISVKKSLFQLKKSQKEIFEAVHGVSFQVNQGEIVGIIGKNGSGKSTMLRAIAGIFSPDAGTIDLHGHSVTLLSIGVGFQKRLTGRENIYLSGMLLGYDEDYIMEHMKEIIEFSELGEFIDRPVRTYSSGMHSKLAFSISAILKPEIMLIDEVLSVGDAKFKKKSFQKMRSLIKDDQRTVVIVSHNLRTLRKLCSRVIWMNDGEIVMDGEAVEVVKAYQKFMEDTPAARKKAKKRKRRLEKALVLLGKEDVDPETLSEPEIKEILKSFAILKANSVLDDKSPVKPVAEQDKTVKEKEIEESDKKKALQNDAVSAAEQD